MESSADTRRVKRNMERTAAYLGLPKENLHMEIGYYILQVNVSDETHSFSKMQLVTNTSLICLPFRMFQNSHGELSKRITRLINMRRN